MYTSEDNKYECLRSCVDVEMYYTEKSRTCFKKCPVGYYKQLGSFLCAPISKNTAATKRIMFEDKTYAYYEEHPVSYSVVQQGITTEGVVSLFRDATDPLIGLQLYATSHEAISYAPFLFLAASTLV